MKTPETNETPEYYDEDLAKAVGGLLSDWLDKVIKKPENKEVIDRINGVSDSDSVDEGRE